MDDIKSEIPSPTPMARGTRTGKKNIGNQAKSVICNVYKFFQTLADDPDKVTTLNFRKVQELTAEACGVSRTTIQKIQRDMCVVQEDPKFDMPRKHLTKKIKRDLDEFEKALVRRCVFNFYDRGEYPTSEKIRCELLEKINFDGGKKSVQRILKNIGFRFRKCSDGRRLLMERKDIACMRATFLRKMHEIRNESQRPIFYVGETWVNQDHSMVWQDRKENGGLTGRLVVVHVGSEKTGFVKDAKLVFQSKKPAVGSDYNFEMSAEVFKEWFTNFLNLLEESSVIVMDNASYHCTLVQEVPRSYWEKNEIQNWLKNHKVQFSIKETKVELLNKPEIKSSPKVYEIDKIAFEMGHEVVRLPPYHAYYNPIEMIWAQVKGEVATRNNTFKMEDVEILLNEAVDRVTTDDWKKFVRHAEGTQNEDYDKQCDRDLAIEPILMRLAEESSDESDLEYELNL